MTSEITIDQTAPAGSVPTSRIAAIAAVDPDAPTRVRRLLDLAPRGLAAAYLPELVDVAQTVRGVSGGTGVRLQTEGTNLRYAAMAALGLARLPEDEQRRVLDGRTAADLAVLTAQRAEHDADPGAIALAAWALVEITGRFPDALLARWRALLDEGRPFATVDLAWLVTAAVAAAPVGDSDALVTRGTTILLDHAGPGGTYPHVIPARTQPRWRAHVGSFADSVYPLQALARASVHAGDPTLLAAANHTAEALCDRQGPTGQWWWHYDARDGSVVEPYPVYSVHQHAMGPMVLFDLLEAGGDDHRVEIAAGLSWLDHHPEVVTELVSERFGLVWRKVGRREPPKAARALHAVATSLRRGWSVPGVDRWLPATVVDHECRPYELGWLLHAWLPAPGEGESHG
jgi:hypothetical protein